MGLLDEERILQMGREITAVGILDSTPDGKPVIKPCSGLPIFLTECTREQLLMELARGTKMLLWLGVIATTFSAGVLTYAVIKYVTHHYYLNRRKTEVLLLPPNKK